MYKHILIPLDGSELAEASLDHAKSIAKAFNSKITLLSVIEPVIIYPQPGMITPTMNITVDLEEETKYVFNYLETLKQQMLSDGFNVGIELSDGHPASRICDYASENEIDLIVMSTHGRSGFHRWVYGSVADKVLRGASIPILLVRINKEK